MKTQGNESREQVSSADEQLLRLKSGDAALVRDPQSPSARDDALDFILAGYEAQPRSTGNARQHWNEATARQAKNTKRTEKIDDGTPSVDLTSPSSDRKTRKQRIRQSTSLSTSQRSALADPHGKSRTTSQRFDRKIERLVSRRIRANAIHPKNLRPRYASVNVRRALPSPFALTFWRTRFAPLARKYDVHVQDDHKDLKNKPHRDDRVASWVAAMKADLNADRELVCISRIGEETIQPPSRIWMTLALYLIRYEIEILPDFLRSSHALPWAHAECVADCLQYLAQHYATDSGRHRQMQDLVNLFGLLAQRAPDDPLALYTNFVRLLIPHCTHEQVSEVYRVIKVHGVRVHGNTLLHLTTFFAKNEHFDQALDALLAAHAAGADLKSVPFRSACSTLLRKAMRQPGGLRVCLRLVDNLVGIGLQLNNQLCNIIMLNAIEAGDLDTAFSIYTSLVDHGLKPDAHTYAILLKGCKMRIDDADTLNDIVRSAVRDIDVLHHPVVASEILHCLALHHTKQNPEQAFAIVLDAYAELFNTTPLVELGVPIQADRSQAARSKKSPSPPPQAISVMLNTYLYHASQVTGTQAALEQVYDIYQRYRGLALSGQEPFATLIGSDYVANGFMMAFNRNRRTLIHSAQVIRDMQQPLPSTNSSPEKRLRQCPPTVISWTIFLHGFRQHQQMKLAAQVLHYMRSRSIEPDNVTWNSLIAGYANVQNFEGVFDTLRHMEAAGAVWDEWTYSGLRRLRDQWRLREELEQVRRMKKLDFTGELREGLERRLAEPEDEVVPHNLPE